MATLSAQLVLSAASGQVSTNAYNLTVLDDNLSVEQPIITSARLQLPLSGASAEVLIASTVSDIRYIYIKNVSSAENVDVFTDGGTKFASIGPTEFAFFPVSVSTGIELKGSHSSTLVEAEYAFFNKA